MTERQQARIEALVAIETLYRLVQEDGGKSFEAAERLNQQAYLTKVAVRDYAMKVRPESMLGPEGSLVHRSRRGASGGDPA